MSTDREPWGQTPPFTRIASRAAAALSLAAVLAGGAVVGQWVLPIEVSRTADAKLPAGIDSLEITAGPGVALHVINRDRVNLPSGYHAVSTATFGAPEPVLNPDLPSMQAACPAGVGRPVPDRPRRIRARTVARGRDRRVTPRVGRDRQRRGRGGGSVGG